MLRKLSLLAALAGALSFTACTTDSDGDGGGGGDSINMALIVNSWLPTAATVNPAIPMIGTDLFAVYSDCDKSAVLELKVNNTYTQAPDPAECEDAEEIEYATDSGTYAVNGVQVTVTSEFDDDPATLTVIELTSTTLKMTQAIPAGEFGDATARTATYTFTAVP